MKTRQFKKTPYLHGVRRHEPTNYCFNFVKLCHDVGGDAVTQEYDRLLDELELRLTAENDAHINLTLVW